MTQHDGAWYDRMYNNRALVPEHAAHFAFWRDASAQVRATHRCFQGVAYGRGLNETLDIFPSDAEGDKAPVVVFVHGGYWRSLDKADHSFIAPMFTAQGAHVVVPNYALCPAVTVSDITLQMVKAVAWVWRNIHRFGGDPSRITLVGHSAGAAIACRMALDGLLAPERVWSINGALMPLDGWAGQFFSPLAKLLAKAPLVPELFAWRAAQADVLQKLLDGTGSHLDAQGQALYRQLIANPGHAGAALAMMAHWDLHALWRDLPGLRTPLALVVGTNDRIVPPQAAQRVALALLHQPTPQVVQMQGLGHLAHEEQPGAIASLLLRS